MSAPETMRRFARKVSRRLDADGFVHDSTCMDLPYTFWNTCPLCVCGLLPVAIVCFSAIFGVDYATHVTEFGAQITNEIGLSYTVYYTAGCWPGYGHESPAQRDLRGGDWWLRSLQDALPHKKLRGSDEYHIPHNLHCSKDRFEVAAGEFDAISGSLLRIRNVTKLNARQMNAVKASPDWRYILFSGILPERNHSLEESRESALPNDGLNLWVVGAGDTDSTDATPLLSREQLGALKARCESEAEDARPAAAERKAGSANSSAKISVSAQLSTFANLQLIAAERREAKLRRQEGLKEKAEEDAEYRLAFAFECKADAQVNASSTPFQFSRLALLDFDVRKTNMTAWEEKHRNSPDEKEQRPPSYHARSQLHLVDIASSSPRASHSCPRFVPSKSGHELLFVTEDLSLADSATDSFTASAYKMKRPTRRLATATIPLTRPEDRLFVQLELDARNEDSLDEVNSMLHSRRLQGEKFSVNPAIAGHSSDSNNVIKKSIATRVVTTTTTATVATTVTIASTVTTSTTIVTTTTTTSTGVSETGAPLVLTVAVDAVLLDMGENANALPWAPARGCPEFLPETDDAYEVSSTLTHILSDVKRMSGYMNSSNFSNEAKELVRTDSEIDRHVHDTFVFESDPSSYSVLGIDAQFLTAELPKERTSGRVENVKLLYNLDNPAVSGSSKSADRHVLSGCQPVRAPGGWSWETLLKKERKPLVCLTADQRLAAVESANPDDWFNMTMPYPVWTGGHPQSVWCPDSRADSCFEVWSLSNPNW